MKTQKDNNEEWILEFDKEFSNIGWYLPNKKRILDFISTLITETEERCRKEMIENLPKENIGHRTLFNIGWDNCIKEIKQSLKTK